MCATDGRRGAPDISCRPYDIFIVLTDTEAGELRYSLTCGLTLLKTCAIRAYQDGGTFYEVMDECNYLNSWQRCHLLESSV